MVGGNVDSQILFGARSEKPKILFGGRGEKRKNLFGAKWQLKFYLAVKGLNDESLVVYEKLWVTRR